MSKRNKKIDAPITDAPTALTCWKMGYSDCENERKKETNTIKVGFNGIKASFDEMLDILIENGQKNPNIGVLLSYKMIKRILSILSQHDRGRKVAGEIKNLRDKTREISDEGILKRIYYRMSGEKPEESEV